MAPPVEALAADLAAVLLYRALLIVSLTGAGILIIGVLMTMVLKDPSLGS
jgi:hypothetical protein